MIAGVDYDTNRVAVCVLPWDSDAAQFVTIEYRRKGEDAFHAIENIFSGVEQLVTIHPEGSKVDSWWIEHAFGRGPADFKLGRVQGAIITALSAAARYAALNEVGPPEWKKGIGLPGNAGKGLYQPQLRLKLAMEFDVGLDQAVTEHELDAFGVALYGRIANGR